MVDDIVKANELLEEMQANRDDQQAKMRRQAKEITTLGKLLRKMRKVVAEQQVELERMR